MLEKIQMPITLHHRVMHRMLSLHPWDGKAAPRDEIDRNRERLPGNVELDPGHTSRRGDAPCRFEQFLLLQKRHNSL
jgi:hypothetical protein